MVLVMVSKKEIKMSGYYKCDLMVVNRASMGGVMIYAKYGHTAMYLVGQLLADFAEKLSISNHRPNFDIYYVNDAHPSRISMKELMADAMIEALYASEGY